MFRFDMVDVKMNIILENSNKWWNRYKNYRY